MSFLCAVLLALSFVLSACTPDAPPAPQDAPASAAPATAGAAETEVAVWTCPMHPEVRSDKPGSCPKCGMALVRVEPEGGEHAQHDDAHMKRMAETRTQLQAKLGVAYDAPVPGLDKADAAKGTQTFARLCASCHGAAGKGDGAAGASLQPPPADFTDPEHARYYSDAGRVEIIRNGSPGTAMVAFGSQLSETELLDLYAHVRTLRGDAAPKTEHAEHEHGEQDAQ